MAKLVIRIPSTRARRDTSSDVPYAESALLLGQKLPGASGGYVHAEHLVEHLRKYAEALQAFIISKTLDSGIR